MNIERSPQPPRRLHPFILLAAFVSTFSIGLISPILPALAERYGGNAFTSGCCLLAIRSHNSSVRPSLEQSAIAMDDER